MQSTLPSNSIASFSASGGGVLPFVRGQVVLVLGVEFFLRCQAALDEFGVYDIEREGAGRQPGGAVGLGHTDAAGDGAGHLEQAFEDLELFDLVGEAEVVEQERAVERVDRAEDEQLIELVRGNCRRWARSRRGAVEPIDALFGCCSCFAVFFCSSWFLSLSGDPPPPMPVPSDKLASRSAGLSGDRFFMTLRTRGLTVLVLCRRRAAKDPVR